jgi:hypothetical protein
MRGGAVVVAAAARRRNAGALAGVEKQRRWHRECKGAAWGSGDGGLAGAEGAAPAVSRAQRMRPASDRAQGMRPSSTRASWIRASRGSRRPPPHRHGQAEGAASVCKQSSSSRNRRREKRARKESANDTWPLGVSFPTLPTCTSIKEKTWDGPNPLSKQELGSSHPKNRVRSNPSLLVLEPNTC